MITSKNIVNENAMHVMAIAIQSIFTFGEIKSSHSEQGV
jgi:hypothetical protein